MKNQIIKDIVDWNEAPLARWMGTISKKGTRNTYRSAYRRYAQFTGLTATQLIDEAIEDRKKGLEDPRMKKDAVKKRLLGFYHWLTTEYEVKSGGKQSKVVRKGVRSKTAHMSINAVRSFYGTYEIYIKLAGRSSLPPARVVNKRLDLTSMDVKRLVMHARSPRDRAMILTMFQGGMDVSTLCGMKYEDVKEGLDKDEHPLKLDLFREKTGVEYYTFLGRDAINAVKAYLNDVRSKGLKHKRTSPLFIKETTKNGQVQAMKTSLVQKVLRETAIRSELVDKEMNGKDMNPASPHALREAMSSIMINKGVPDSIVDFWIGHNIGYMAEAYKRRRFEDVKQMYKDREQHISISQPPVDLKEVEKKVRVEIDEHNKELQERMIYLLKKVEEYDRKQGVMRKEISDLRAKGDISETKFKRLVDVLARTKNINKAIEKFRRLGDNPEPNGNNNIKVVRGETALVDHLKKGWILVKELNHDKYLLKPV